MISESVMIASHTKAFVASVGLFGTVIADISTQPGTLEDYTLKGGSAALIIYLVRVILKSWDDHKQTLTQTVAANTEAMEGVRQTLERQNEFFDGIGKQAVETAMKGTYSLKGDK